MSKFHALEVSNIDKETDDCVSLTFAVPDDLKDMFKYTQGQHVSVRADIGGEDIRRSYSICSSVGEDKLRVAVRAVEGGRMSGFINNDLKAGDSIDVFPPSGHFFVDIGAKNKKTYVAFAGGSGITPIMSIIKTTLEVEPESEFMLFYANRSPASTIFRQELSQLKNRFMTRFSFFHFLSEEKQEFEFFNGFIDYAKTKEIMENMVSVDNVDHYFICGPGSMISDIEKALLECGAANEQIHYELFTTDGVTVAKKDAASAKAVTASDCEITMTLDGVERTFSYAPSDGSVLDAASKTGADVPYSCRGGVCCTCRAKVIEGSVEMAVNYGLEPDEVEAGYVLTCQSTPTSKTLVLNYDK